MLGRKSKALKEGEANLAGDHIREGLTCIVAVKVLPLGLLHRDLQHTDTLLASTSHSACGTRQGGWTWHSAPG